MRELEKIKRERAEQRAREVSSVSDQHCVLQNRADGCLRRLKRKPKSRNKENLI